MFVTYAAMEDMPSVRLGDGRTVKAEGKEVFVCASEITNKLKGRSVCLVCYLCQTYPAICSLSGTSQIRETG